MSTSARPSAITRKLSDVAEAVMCGFGTQGYNLALQFIHAKLPQAAVQ